MMTWIDETLPAQLQKLFVSAKHVWSLTGEAITKDKLCTVEKVNLNGHTFYLKRYRRTTSIFAAIFGRSRLNREWVNLNWFKRWSLPTANIAAYSSTKRGSIERGYLITEEIKGSKDLAFLAKNHPDKFQRGNWLHSIVEQIACGTRTMHKHNFAHNDLKWRNILVANSQDKPKVFFIDCPSGRFWWGPFFTYRRIKDLACLDKVAKQVMSNTQRLRFFLSYCQHHKLTAADKKDIRKILAFFRGRE